MSVSARAARRISRINSYRRCATNSAAMSREEPPRDPYGNGQRHDRSLSRTPRARTGAPGRRRCRRHARDARQDHHVPGACRCSTRHRRRYRLHDHERPPPLGMKMLVDELQLQDPIAAFNGGLFVRPDLSVIRERLVPREAVHSVIHVLSKDALDVWIYTDADWRVRSRHGPHVDREEWTVKFAPPSSRPSRMYWTAS